jgi:hypothetical protein
MTIAGDRWAGYTGVLNGNMKDVYHKGGITNLFPAVTPLVKTIGGMTAVKQKIGRKFIWPLGTSYSQGHSYHAAGAGAFAFRKIRPGRTLQAEIDAVQHMHRSGTDWETLERAAPDRGNIPDGAFEGTAKRILKDLQIGTFQRVEESLWYGSTNLAIFVQGSADVRNETLGGETVEILELKVTYESWATQLFTGKSGGGVVGRGAPYDLYELDSNGRPTGTRKNVAATETLGDGTTTYRPIELAAVASLSDRKLWFIGHNTDLTAIETVVNTVDSKRYGLVYWDANGNETKGIDWIVTNGDDAEIYGLDPLASEYLRGNVLDNNDQEMTYRRFLNAQEPLVQLGLNTAVAEYAQSAMQDDGDLEKLSIVDVWMNPATSRDLLGNETGQVRHNNPGGKVTQGFNLVEFVTDLGRTRFWSYPKIKQGEMHIFPTSMICKVVGTEMPYLKDWSDGEEKYFRQVEGVSGVEAAMYGLLGLYVTYPAWMLKITGIRNSNYGNGQAED